MTWSIIARDPLTGHIGIAVATRFFAVGARVPHIAPGIGGVATQALVNPYYGIDGVKLLREGRSPREVVDTLIAADDGRESRQLHVMDIKGRIAAHTGRECIDWCGSIQGDGFSLAGNMLAGEAVLDDTARAFADNAGLPFCATADRGDEGRRSRRRRQARQAIGGAGDPWRRGMVRSRPARRRPHRSARRTRTAGTGQPRALGAFPPIHADAQQSRPGSPTAPIIDATIEAATARKA